MIIPFGGKKPVIGKNVFVAPTAVVIGDVRIGDNASIWFNAVLRGDMAPIDVGENTNIQDNCTVHTDLGKPAVIGRNVTVGHNAVVHGCTVEDGSLIAMGAVVLNGARIKRGSVVAAGAIVMENQQVGPGQLAAGAPAKIKKAVKETPDGAIPEAVQDYLELSRAYLAAEVGRCEP